jgi:hypothetical protein
VLVISATSFKKKKKKKSRINIERGRKEEAE